MSKLRRLVYLAAAAILGVLMSAPTGLLRRADRDPEAVVVFALTGVVVAPLLRRAIERAAGSGRLSRAARSRPLA